MSEELETIRTRERKLETYLFYIIALLFVIIVVESSMLIIIDDIVIKAVSIIILLVSGVLYIMAFEFREKLS